MKKTKLLMKKLAGVLGQLTDKFSEVKLKDDTILSMEKVEVGVDVFDSEGNPVNDGDYILEDERTITVVNGKITEIKEKETTEPTAEPTEPTETTTETTEQSVDERIASLENRVVELETTVESLYQSMLEMANVETATRDSFSKLNQKFEAFSKTPSAKSLTEENQNFESNSFATKLQKIKDLKNNK